MSEPVNQINHAEVIRRGLLNPSGLVVASNKDCIASCVDLALASLAAMHKELEAYQTAQPDLRRQFIEKEATITAQAERIARLEAMLNRLVVADEAGELDDNLFRAAKTLLTPPTP